MVAAHFLASASVLFASVALAGPLEHRTTGAQHSRLFQGTSQSNITNTYYNSAWAGAAWSDQPPGTFTSVTGTFTVPTPTGSNGSSTAWVGIDGYSCQTALLQTGIDFTISGGQVSYSTWLEWVPAAQVSYDSASDISFFGGDSVTLTVTATSATTGIATIENNTSGQKVTQEISSSSPLCQQDAEWIVEDYSVNGAPVIFDDFGTVTFTAASASMSNGTSIGPSGAGLVDIQQNGQNLTLSSTSYSGVTIQYL
ncbi:hypothetical protein HWV62_27103 [Athelia sp. TMB]|nr:hypothetical protein HWV62_27103 [Athelia sp. TMB]